MNNKEFKTYMESKKQKCKTCCICKRTAKTGNYLYSDDVLILYSDDVLIWDDPKSGLDVEVKCSMQDLNIRSSFKPYSTEQLWFNLCPECFREHIVSSIEKAVIKQDEVENE